MPHAIETPPSSHSPSPDDNHGLPSITNVGGPSSRDAPASDTAATSLVAISAFVLLNESSRYPDGVNGLDAAHLSSLADEMETNGLTGDVLVAHCMRRIRQDKSWLANLGIVDDRDPQLTAIESKLFSIIRRSQDPSAAQALDPRSTSASRFATSTTPSPASVQSSSRAGHGDQTVPSRTSSQSPVRGRARRRRVQAFGV